MGNKKFVFLTRLKAEYLTLEELKRKVQAYKDAGIPYSVLERVETIHVSYREINI
ncbi:MAG: hypothetical protein IJB98_03615 [Clostridia bacterium]|nr:hypothetical protein [Clostridia bacterium]